MAPIPLIDEFLAICRTEPDECWPWLRAISTQGYGRVMIGDRQTAAHRVIYELFVGPIPEGYEVDHVCHNEDTSCPGGPTCLHRRCCNPEHLRAVTHRENDLAGRKGPVAVCVNGHPRTEENLHRSAIRPRGVCKGCARMYSQRAAARRKEARRQSREGQ